MSSINPSEYVLLDTNAENATLTPLQTTPSLTPSDSPSPALPPQRINTAATTAGTTVFVNNAGSTAHLQVQSVAISGIQSYEAFARELELKRTEWYLEAAVISKCMDDEASERMNSEKATGLLAQLYPSASESESDCASSIFSIRTSKYLLKHSKPEWALSALSTIPISTDTNARSLPSSIHEKEDRITYWYYKSLATLELQQQQQQSPLSITATNGTEDLIKNGMIEAVGCVNEETRKKWINVGYFLMAVYSLLRGDEIDARFWKGQLPVGYSLPEGVYCTHEGLVEGLGGMQMPVMGGGGARGEMNTPRPLPQQSSASSSSSGANRDVINQLQGLTTADIAMRDVARLKRDVSDIYDSVNMNYREMHERIKAIHSILDGGKGGVSREEVEELKKRLGYLEGVALRG